MDRSVISGKLHCSPSMTLDKIRVERVVRNITWELYSRRRGIAIVDPDIILMNYFSHSS